MLDRILTDLNAGWWKFNRRSLHFTFSGFIKKLLRLNTDTLSLEEFIEMVRKDYREKLLQIRENAFYAERIFPLIHENEEIWVHSKHLGKDDESNSENIEFGYFQLIPNPELVSPDKAASLRLNNLLYQLNSVSQILLSFLKSDNTEEIINQLLSDILKQFSAGRTYIFEYDWENETQSCTYEIVDKNIKPEKDILIDLPITHNDWWSNQLLTGHSIILSHLDELPPEAAEAKELLMVQDIKSLMVVPLVSKNGIWGYVGIDVVDNLHQWSEDDCLWFNSLVNIISLFIELNRSEKTALFDKSQLQRLYQNMPLSYLRLKILTDETENPVDYFPIEANQAALRLFQIDISNLIGVKGSKIRNHNFQEELNRLRNILQTDEHIEIQQWIEEINRYCNMVMYAVDKDEIVCLISDITESHQMHEELDRSEKILRNIYDNLPVGIELYDKNGKLIDMNASDMKMFGLTEKEDALGVNLFDNPNIPESALNLLRNQQPASFRIRYSFDVVEDYYSSNKDGAIEIYVKANALYDKNGNVINYLFINIDNTEINQAYSRIAEFEHSFSINK